ncbi:calcium/calcium/calmodulin-dependent Serine/Threonine-kinase [Perilla frutescens var. hirtella]|uniref:Calcium/calcium/calmodulin-dependent Serine/Threonine-kinase n=1 Tax=Perilla frutescens var. hirtella TaxID=608512 RepID=A0AAD4PBC9_PERFH|nr:calcium/calcium/calmodulin-dependent Serine/Threonine-kinase [Perilla frutescens var. hirtella]
MLTVLQILEFGQSHLVSKTQLLQENSFTSVLGDPGMKSPNSRFAFEAWNFCNEVGMEAPKMGSPRLADCADLYCPDIADESNSSFADEKTKCAVHQKVKESDNKLRAGDGFPSSEFKSSTDPDIYAVEKELYLGSLCEAPDSAEYWYFWMIMLKNGNFDKNTTLCPENGKKVDKIVTDRSFPCFGEGCMNQPLVYHNQSKVVSFVDSNVSMVGGFYGTYDLDADLSAGVGKNSFFSASWKKNSNTSSWIVSQKLTTSAKYPWLMLYLRADAAEGFNGGYHYNGRGIMKKLPVSPNFKVRLTLDVKQGGGPNSQFYMVDIGSCWKNNGDPCDGDVLTDVTRYSEMIINPATTSWCRPDNLVSCPPYHMSSTGEMIRRNDTSRFPYSAYHLYCAPGNARFLEKPYDICDPYSNPQAQELVQILPHREWAVHGYPERKGDGWVGDSRTWELDTGALSSRLYFYQDPGTKPAKRVWTSINVGTEIYVSPSGATAEWSVSDFDVLVPNSVEEGRKEYM